MVVLLIFAYWFGSRFLASFLKRAVESFEPASATPVIPLHIYQTWKTKKLPRRMQECVEKLKRMNPEFTHHLYDDADCEQFIRKHYGEDVAKAYTTLVPGAYKADLWRYCVLHQNGGIYLDIKYCNTDKCTLMDFVDKEYFVYDSTAVESTSKIGIYNGLMICRPGNPKLGNCIQQIVKNVNSRFYGTNPLDITGPTLLVPYFSEDEVAEIRNELVYDNRTNTIRRNGVALCKQYKGYYHSDNLGPRYDVLWNQRKIYTTDTQDAPPSTYPLDDPLG